MTEGRHKLRIAGILNDSIVDGPGLRFVVFAQGCTFNCPGCHNLETHPLDGGRGVYLDDILRDINKNPLLDGLTISGGEPFIQAEVFAILAEKVKAQGLNVWVYSGYTLEELLSGMDKNPAWKSLLDKADVLVDGRFILAERTLDEAFKGSRNQRILDVKKSICQGTPILLEL